MAETADTYQLLEPDPPADLLPAIGDWPWLLGALLLVLGLVAAAIFIQLRKRILPDPNAHRAAAKARALAALDACDLPAARETAIRASLIIRSYLADACAEPALFETHEEFNARHDALAPLSDDAKLAAAQFFAKLAAMKYDRDSPAADTRGIIAESRTLLDTLHRGFI